MMSTQRTGIGTVALLALLVGLGGCGGGGSGDDGTGVVVPTEPITISSANAVTVASAVLDAAVSLSEFNAGPFAAAAADSGSSAASSETRLALSDLVSSRVEPLLALLPQAGAEVTVAVVIPTTTFDCQVSGTMTISGDIADPTGNTLTPGDVITATFSSCDDGDGVLVSGTLQLTVQAFTGNFSVPPYSYTVLATLTNYAITESGETLSINGTATLTESTQDDIVFTTRFSGTSLSFVESVGDTGTLSNFINAETDNLNTLEYTIDASGTLATVQLGGSVQYTTTLTFRGLADNFPSEGVMVVTGAGNSTETITSVDTVNVSIDVDENGDGIVDQTIATTWAAL
jgi:hypothetical protein